VIRADDVFFLVADPVTSHWLERERPDARSLDGLYTPGKLRRETYAEIAEALLTRVRAGAAVCAVFYGHPGVLVRPAQLALAQARREGYDARMLPGVSSLDCLFADLELDPAEGLQTYEATSFLVGGRIPDATALLVLWQVGSLGEEAHRSEVDVSRVPVLVEYLERFYSSRHETIVYEASPFPGCDPGIQRVALGRLAEARITPASTLVVPPARPPQDDQPLRAALGLG
jgi:tetrapyrrole (corrin/porphyrin) methylase-like protein